MSKTISFVASDDLAEFLEEESERRMTTVSSTAQMLLAERVREIRGEEGEVEAGLAGSGGAEDAEDDVFDRHPDAWYRPSGKHSYAVHVPADAGVTDSGEPRYYKTRSGVAEALRRWYE